MSTPGRTKGEYRSAQHKGTPMRPRSTPIRPQLRDLGSGFTVCRLLPAVPRQVVRPFLFFDHFGPITAAPTDNHDVRAHPRIGLATVT